MYADGHFACPQTSFPPSASAGCVPRPCSRSPLFVREIKCDARGNKNQGVSNRKELRACQSIRCSAWSCRILSNIGEIIHWAAAIFAPGPGVKGPKRSVVKPKKQNAKGTLCKERFRAPIQFHCSSVAPKRREIGRLESEPEPTQNCRWEMGKDPCGGNEPSTLPVKCEAVCIITWPMPCSLQLEEKESRLRTTSKD